MFAFYCCFFKIKLLLLWIELRILSLAFILQFSIQKNHFKFTLHNPRSKMSTFSYQPLKKTLLYFSTVDTFKSKYWCTEILTFLCAVVHTMYDYEWHSHLSLTFSISLSFHLSLPRNVIVEGEKKPTILYVSVCKCICNIQLYCAVTIHQLRLLVLVQHTFDVHKTSDSDSVFLVAIGNISG